MLAMAASSAMLVAAPISSSRRAISGIAVPLRAAHALRFGSGVVGYSLRVGVVIRIEVVVRKRPNTPVALAVDAARLLLAAELTDAHIQTRSGLRLVVKPPLGAGGLEPRNPLAQFVDV